MIIQRSNADHSQIIGEGAVKILGNIPRIPPPGFRHPACGPPSKGPQW